MSWLDQARSKLGEAAQSAAGDGGFAGLFERMLPGGLQAVLDQFQGSGLGQQVNSWLGRGPNEPLTVDDVRNALSNEQVQAVARSLGVPVDRALEIIAGQLPQAIDQASPDGQLKTPPAP